MPYRFPPNSRSTAPLRRLFMLPGLAGKRIPGPAGQSYVQVQSCCPQSERKGADAEATPIGEAVATLGCRWAAGLQMTMTMSVTGTLTPTSASFHSD